MPEPKDGVIRLVEGKGAFISFLTSFSILDVFSCGLIQPPGLYVACEKLSSGLSSLPGRKHDRVSESKHSKHREREGTLKKHAKDSEMAHANVSRGTVSEGHEPAVAERHIVLRRRGSEGSSAVRKAGESTEGSDAAAPPAKPNVGSDGSRGESLDRTPPPSAADPSKDSKPLLKLKFKNLYSENRSSWVSQGEENHSVKKQRSKRRRPSPLMDKSGSQEDETAEAGQENMTEEVMDANWILQKLGKGAIGKRVEVHHQSGGSW